MCGRFVSSSSPERIAAYFGADAAVESLGENYNVAPTNDIYGVVLEGPSSGLCRFQWYMWAGLASFGTLIAFSVDDSNGPKLPPAFFVYYGPFSD